jgi:DNA-binding SARP family transcriptional activator
VDRLVLALLGGFKARLESGPDVSVRTSKGQALLAYLACHPMRSHPRDALATLLWGDARQGAARQSLRQTLFLLRAPLPEPISAMLRCDAHTVSLDRTHLVVDVVELERLAGDGTVQSLERAGALYQGDLLAGIPVVEPSFEEWLRGERERYRDLAVDVLARLLDLQRAAGLTESAIRTGLRLLRLDPFQEVVHRTLMRLYVSVGRPDKARRQYLVCAQTLRRELDMDPSAETEQLHREIVRSGARRLASM